MNHSCRPLLAVALLCMSLLTNSCSNKPQSLAGEAGFVEAYFDAASLNSLLSGAGCTHIRFYNARRLASDTKGTAIAIAVSGSATGAPIYNGTTLKYRMHDRFTSGTTPMVQLTKAEAQVRIGYVKTAGEKSYAASFKKADIQYFLAAAGCTGVRLVPERTTNGDYTMRMHPASISGSGGMPNPAPPSMLCGEPCPSVCGDIAANYIHL